MEERHAFIREKQINYKNPRERHDFIRERHK